VFRVQHFETLHQQDIYNLRLGRDENIMMRHILYLVALLQREAEISNWNLDEAHEEDEDGPSNCNDAVEDEDEDGGGIDEEGINEYGRVEAENHSNENDKYCDMNDGKDESSVDPAFPLPSGLWLHLSDSNYR
jgi:hypothetical protein